ncbi:MAG TPA: hypothetical protein VKA65_18695 [Acidimicrobiales bacterium]|nr:hypothetical protein [Acidimicrobiales bacterium]
MTTTCSDLDHQGTKRPATAVDRFLDAIRTASIPDADVWAADARLDATVPNWRLGVEGADAIRDTYAGWFADPGRFEELRRLPVPGGELVEYTLSWEESGVPHAAHHAHVLILGRDGRIVDDHVFCGGRWNAALLAEMESAAGG